MREVTVVYNQGDVANPVGDRYCLFEDQFWGRAAPSARP
jgi:hypothetical protein